MADATDLKSVGSKGPCGFESRHRHQEFTREKASGEKESIAEVDFLHHREKHLDLSSFEKTFRQMWVCNPLPVSPNFARALSEACSNQGCACNALGQLGSDALASR